MYTTCMLHVYRTMNHQAHLMAKKLCARQILENRLKVIEEIHVENPAWIYKQLSELGLPTTIKANSFIDPLDHPIDQHISEIRNLQADLEIEAWIHRLDTVINRWRTPKSRERNGKRPTSLDLTIEAKGMLKTIAHHQKTSQSAVVESLIRKAAKQSPRRAKKPSPNRKSSGPPLPQQYGMSQLADSPENTAAPEKRNPDENN